MPAASSTTVFDIEVDGQKTRVILATSSSTRSSDRPIHVDFQRLGEGAVIRVAVPVHFINQEGSPGIKRGGTLNVVRHTVDFYAPAGEHSGIGSRPILPASKSTTRCTSRR